MLLVVAACCGLMTFSSPAAAQAQASVVEKSLAAPTASPSDGTAPATPPSEGTTPDVVTPDLGDPSSARLLPWQAKPSLDATFAYREPQSAKYLRAAGFQVAVLVGGAAWYYWDKETNQLDWEYSYDWETFRAKLEGSGYSFDSNLFDTNSLAHTGAGTLYYIGARGSRMTIWGALGVAFTSSLFWEFIGEFRERVSMNDMLVTPLGGMAFGESLLQLGAFFDRSCDTMVNRVLSDIFAPSKAYGDLVDGAELLRSSRCDRYGFTRVGYHEFEISAGPRLVRSSGATDAEPYVVGEIRARAETLNLRRFGQPGSGWMSFADGNGSTVEVVAATGTMGTEDFRVDTRALLAGLHYRDIRHGAGGVHGREFLLGAGVGVEYSRHLYGDQSQRLDPVFILEAPALFARWRWLLGARQLDVSLVAAPSYASVGAFALPEYDLLQDRTELTTVARQHGYNHALGISLAPRVVWSGEQVRIGVEARNDRLFAVRAMDREAQSESRAEVSEFRRRARVWFETGPRRGLRFRIDAAARVRRGQIDQLQRRVSEARIGAGLTGVF